MTETMKAAVLHAEKDLRVEDVARPEPGPGEVLVKVRANGLCHTDLTYYTGQIPDPLKKYPLILGHEAAGMVATLGSGATALNEGDAVLLPPVYGCGACKTCLGGEDNICPKSEMLGGTRDGAYAQYVAVPEKYAFKMSADLDLTYACVAADAVSTIYFALKERVGLREGDHVAVFGCGGLGLAALAVSKALGAEKTYAVDVREASLEQASALGAAVFNAKEHDRIDKALKKESGGAIRVGVDCVGKAATIQNAFSTVRRGGEVAVIGYTMEDVSFKAGAFMGLQKRIGGSWGCPTRLFPDVITLLEGGKIPLDLLVSKTYPLDKIMDAFDALHKGEVTGRAVVEIPS